MEWLAWLMLVDWKLVATLVGLIIAIPTAIAVIKNKILKPMYEFAKRAWGCLSRVEKYMTVLDTIAHEFRPNGGNSLRDVLNRVEAHMVITDTKIQAIMNYHGIAAWESDSEGRWIWASDQLLDLLNMSMPEVSGLGWVMGVDEPDRARVRQEWESAVADQRNFYLIYNVGTDNKKTKVVGRAYYIRDMSGKIKGYIGTLKPVPSESELQNFAPPAQLLTQRR